MNVNMGTKIIKKYDAKKDLQASISLVKCLQLYVFNKIKKILKLKEGRNTNMFLAISFIRKLCRLGIAL